MALAKEPSRRFSHNWAPIGPGCSQKIRTGRRASFFIVTVGAVRQWSSLPANSRRTGFSFFLLFSVRRFGVDDRVIPPYIARRANCDPPDGMDHVARGNPRCRSLRNPCELL